jgi:hypothetical protein
MYDTFMYASFVNNTMCFQCFSECVVNLNQQYFSVERSHLSQLD